MALDRLLIPSSSSLSSLPSQPIFGNPGCLEWIAIGPLFLFLISVFHTYFPDPFRPFRHINLFLDRIGSQMVLIPYLFSLSPTYLSLPTNPLSTIDVPTLCITYSSYWTYHRSSPSIVIRDPSLPSLSIRTQWFLGHSDNPWNARTFGMVGRTSWPRHLLDKRKH